MFIFFLLVQKENEPKEKRHESGQRHLGMVMVKNEVWNVESGLWSANYFGLRTSQFTFVQVGTPPKRQWHFESPTLSSPLQGLTYGNFSFFATDPSHFAYDDAREKIQKRLSWYFEEKMSCTKLSCTKEEDTKFSDSFYFSSEWPQVLNKKYFHILYVVLKFIIFVRQNIIFIFSIWMLLYQIIASSPWITPSHP